MLRTAVALIKRSSHGCNNNHSNKPKPKAQTKMCAILTENVIEHVIKNLEYSAGGSSTRQHSVPLGAWKRTCGSDEMLRVQGFLLGDKDPEESPKPVSSRGICIGFLGEKVLWSNCQRSASGSSRTARSLDAAKLLFGEGIGWSNGQVCFQHQLPHP